MPRSRNRPKPRPSPARRRWDWRRVAGGLAEFTRNLGLIAFGTAFAEPLLTGAPLDVVKGGIAVVWGLLFVGSSVIIDHERRD